MYLYKVVFSISLITLAFFLPVQKSNLHDNNNVFLDIPSINVSSIVVNIGVSPTLLDYGLLLDISSVDTNNWVIYGHRFSYKKLLDEPFFNLDKVRVGDMIILKFQGEYLTYLVEDVYIIPSSLSLPPPKNGSKSVTLVTCTPISDPVDRLVVVAYKKGA